MKCCTLVVLAMLFVGLSHQDAGFAKEQIVPSKVTLDKIIQWRTALQEHLRAEGWGAIGKAAGVEVKANGASEPVAATLKKLLVVFKNQSPSLKLSKSEGLEVRLAEAALVSMEGKLEQCLKMITEEDALIAKSSVDLEVAYQVIRRNALAGLRRWGDAHHCIVRLAELQPQSWRRLNHLATSHARFSRYGQAKELYLRCVEIAGKEGGESPKAAYSYFELGRVEMMLENLEEAQSLMEKSIAVDEKIDNDNTPRFSEHCSTLGLVKKRLGKLEEAKSLIAKAIATDERLFPNDHPRFAIAYSNLAAVESELGNMNAARSLLQNAIEITRKAYGKDHHDLVMYCETLSGIQWQLGDEVSARTLMQEAVDIHTRTKGEENQQAFVLLSRMAAIERALQNPKQTELLLRKAIAVKSKIDGDKHHDLGRSYFELGVVFLETEEFSEAQSMLQKAVSIQERFPEEPHTAEVLSVLAVTERQLGNFEQAKSLYERLIDNAESRFGPEYPGLSEYYVALAFTLQGEDALDEAKVCVKKAIAIDAKHLSPDDLQFVSSYTQLASIEMQQGNKDDARRLLSKALGISLNKLGSQHATTKRVSTLLGRANSMNEQVASLTLEVAEISACRVALQKVIQNEAKESSQRAISGPEDKEVPVASKSLAAKLKSLVLKFNRQDTTANRPKYVDLEIRLAEATAANAEREFERSLELIKKEDELIAKPYVEQQIVLKVVRKDALLGLERWKEAHHCMARLVELQPENVFRLHELAASSVRLSRYDQAKEQFLRCIEMREKGPSGSVDTALYFDLGSVEMRLGNLAEANSLMEKAMALDREFYGDEHPRLASQYSILGVVKQRLGKLDEAKQMIEKGIAIDEKSFPVGHPRFALTYTNLASVESELGNLEEARSLLHKSIEISQKAHGESHLYLATDYEYLAGVEERLGNAEEARKLLQKSLGIYTKSFGEDHHRVFVLYSKMAGLERTLKNLKQSALLLKKAIAAKLNAPGDNRRALDRSYFKLGVVLFDMGELSEAREMFREVLSIHEDFPEEGPAENGQRGIETRYVLAIVERRLGNLEESKSLLQYVISDGEKRHGPDHPALSKCYFSLALALQDEGALDEAKMNVKKSIAIDTEHVSSSNPQFATSYTVLGKIEKLQGNAAEAERLWKKALEVANDRFGPEHAKTKEIAALVKGVSD